MISDPIDEISRAAFEGRLDTLRLLLRDDINLDAEGPSWGNPLHSAIENYQIESMRLLLEAGAGVDYAIRLAPDRPKVSPLEHALDLILVANSSYDGRPGDEPTDMVWMLLAYGADPRSGIDTARYYNSDRFVSLLEHFYRVRWGR